MSRQERKALRKQVSNWARLELRRSKLSRLQVQTAMRQPDGWLGNRLSGDTVTLQPAQLQEFAKILGVALPEEILDAAIRSGASRRSGSSASARLPRITDGEIVAAASASREMALILEAASHGRPQRVRDLDWASRRFGLGTGKPETLEEIGATAGVTRERVRQVESKMLKLASVVAAGHRLPILASVHQRVLESVGLPWDAVERELQRFLGGIPLREAVRFIEEIQPPDQRVGMDRASIYGLGKMLRVVATSPEDIRFTSQVSTAARKIFSFAGAALVNDVRALLETMRKKPVVLRDLVRTLGALPEIQWLDNKQRWCWFDTPDLSPLLRRAAIILTTARVPVDMETLYAGLVREGRRDFTSQASDVTDPVPPAHVVHAILMRHPLFRRTSANAFTFLGELELDQVTEPAMRLVIQRLDELGGAATRSELYDLENHPEHPIQRQSFAFYLYCAGFLERIGPAAWAIRGRPIEEARRREVIAGSPRTYSASAYPPQLRPSGPRWGVLLRLTDPARRNRLVAFPSASVPDGVAGHYRLPDGHQVKLHLDRHGPRMTALGERIKALMADSDVAALHFQFDAETREVFVEPLPLGETGPPLHPQDES